ncbi:MAG: 2-oxoacid:ferredoxin oxidoreductase subunit beta, partial [bacterium]|nr:2-oxoacid:ferredoxin oxidoreductase subunit beta [bacterium]
MREKNNKFRTNQQSTWCPGCANFGILAALENAFKKLGLEPWQIFASFGIGCHGQMSNYLNVYSFEGLHGRALPLAIGVKVANKNLTVLSVAGDGDQLGEGGNHFIHACRKNPDITCLIHNNQLYSLTVGQASPTSDLGSRTRTTPQGVFDQPFNPVALAIVSGASFVARAFAGDIPHLTEVLVKAIQHKGFSVVDILQPCIALNSVNTFDWFRKRIYNINDISSNPARYKLEESGYEPSSKIVALGKAFEWGEKIPVGIFYREDRPTLEENL